MDDAGFEQYVIKRLTEYILATGLTAYQFAAVTGLSRSTVYNCLEGKAKPSFYILGIVMNYLQIGPSEFFAGYSNNKRNSNVPEAESTASMEMLNLIYSKLNSLEDVMAAQNELLMKMK